nr:MAG TPA: hypothetical protein [Caudoviricetes sp.]
MFITQPGRNPLGSRSMPCHCAQINQPKFGQHMSAFRVKVNLE